MSGAADRLLKQWDTKTRATFKIKAGEKHVMRLLPPYPAEYLKRAEELGATMDPRLGIVVIHAHKFLPKLNPSKDEIERAQKFQRGPDKRPVTNYRCLRDFRKPCPFCQFFESLGKDDKEIRYQYGCKAEATADFYMRALGICQRWYSMPKTVVERIYQIADILPQLNDRKYGQYLVVGRTGSTQYDTTYEVNVRPRKKSPSGKDILTPLKLPDEQFPDDLLDYVKEYPVIPGPKAAMKVIRLKFPEMV